MGNAEQRGLGHFPSKHFATQKSPLYMRRHCVSCVPFTARSFVLFADSDESQRFLTGTVSFCQGKPVVDRTEFSSYVDVKKGEIEQALFNKGYPIYETYFTAGLGSKGPNKLETLKYPTSEVQKQNWLTYMSGSVDMMVNNPCCFAMSVRSIGSEDYYIALVVGKKFPH